MEVRLSDLGKNIEKATLTFWFVQEGSEVKKDDDLAEVSTDKAVFTLPSPASGKVVKINIEEGADISSSDILCIIE